MNLFKAIQTHREFKKLKRDFFGVFAGGGAASFFGLPATTYVFFAGCCILDFNIAASNRCFSSLTSTPFATFAFALKSLSFAFVPDDCIVELDGVSVEEWEAKEEGTDDERAVFRRFDLASAAALVPAIGMTWRHILHVYTCEEDRSEGDSRIGAGSRLKRAYNCVANLRRLLCICTS